MTRSIPKHYARNRIYATVIDYIIVFGMTIFYIVEAGTSDGEGTYSISGLPALVPVAFWFAYIVLAEQYMDGTLGHLLMKLKVVSLDGQKPSLGQTIKRRLSDALEIAWCCGLIAFLLAKNTQLHQRLGDILARTIVIGKDEIYPAEIFDFEKS